ncbi:MAG: phosphatase PAP2 family protein [Gammaproteobacteria bacterium]|nr:phosphatase PAP2 family protein [Gammaproteobacteria bacterium]
MTFFLDDDCASGDDCASPGLFADSVGMAVDWGHLNGAPRHDLAVALVRTEFVTYGLKYGVQEQRPNGAGESFPSGHTSISFAGAEFIRKQYGWGWGVPAYLAASYVGWSRVESGNHWTHDVLAGAAIGILSNHDLERIELPFGTLSLAGGRVAGFAHAALTNLDGANDALAADAPAPAAGLRIELRF